MDGLRMIEQLKSNIIQTRQRIADAARRSGREPESVCLIAVTKYVDVAMTRAIVAAGCHDIGENRPQVLWEKADSLTDVDVNWHLIGHLQRNKVKRTVGLTKLIHSVDSIRLLEAIEEAASGDDRRVSVLLEVNVSGEQAKHGLTAADLGRVLEHASRLRNVAVEGLMCMAGLESDPEDARREFAMLRELAEAHQANTSDNVRLHELSMGMSGDFEIAIEEGATMVRVGSLLLQGLE